MSARKEITGCCEKGFMMETNGGSIKNMTPGLIFSTINHSNPTKTSNAIVIRTGFICHSKFVPFVVPWAVIMLAIMSMPSTDVTITWMMIPFLLKFISVLYNVSLVTRLVAKIKTMISSTVEACSDLTMYNPLAWSCKVFAKIISIPENMRYFGNHRMRLQLGAKGQSALNSSWVRQYWKTVLKSSLLQLIKAQRIPP